MVREALDDIVISLVGLMVMSPIIVALALWIRLDSEGGALFSQERLGRSGRLFRCLKFRTMRSDAEDLLRSQPDLYELYLANEILSFPRGWTSVRRALMSSPQLWNVLKGDMSLVGPRPIVPDELMHYDRVSSLLLSLRPGITGKWTVGGRNSVAYPKRADMELEYIRNWSVLGDLEILLRTGRVVWKGGGGALNPLSSDPNLDSRATSSKCHVGLPGD